MPIINSSNEEEVKLLLVEELLKEGYLISAGRAIDTPIGRNGKLFYESRVKAMLESSFNNKFFKNHILKFYVIFFTTTVAMIKWPRIVRICQIITNYVPTITIIKATFSL